MTAINFRNGDHPYTGQVRLFDAQGNEWDSVRECDQETGRIVLVVFDSYGQVVPDPAEDYGTPLEVTVMAPAPLRFTDLDGNKEIDITAPPKEI